MKKIILIPILFLFIQATAQTDSTQYGVSLSGYVETYYSYDFNKPQNHTKPAFIYSHNRHQEVNLNLGFLKASYQQKYTRANLALMTGTYANANLAAEPGVLKNIYEANAGVKISKRKNLWIDAGIFSSHIGFESAISKDCWNLTRSMLADNSPYFETGAKLTYTTTNDKLTFSALLLNGWQRIQRVDGNNTLAFGHQLIIKPNTAITINSSSFVGSDKPDSARQMRYFHNLYGIFQLNKQIGLIAGFDIGAEQSAKGSSRYNCWYSPVIIARFRINDKNFLAARIEYYDDQHGVIINSGTVHGFQTWGYSLNYDYCIRENVLWRIEAKNLSARDNLFVKDNVPVKNDFNLTTSLAISF